MKTLNMTRCVAIAAILMLAASTGCSTFGPMSADRDLPTANSPVGAENGGYSVYMDGMKNRDPFHGMVSRDMNNPTTVQMALQQSGAIKNFKGMHIDVVRTVAESGQQLKMPVEYVIREKAVRMEQDYTLHPGDVIMIRAKSSTAMDQMLDSIGITQLGY